MRKRGPRTRGRKKSTSFWVIVSLSILYMVAAILLFRGSDAWSFFSTSNFKKLVDFLAALFTAEFLTVLFTPLTFLWVLYGFSQQSREHANRSRPHLTLRIVSPEDWWDWIVENKGGDAKNMELSNLNEQRTVDNRNSLAHDENFQFTVATISSAHSYEARFSSERSERFHQRWEIDKGKCKEITHGPEPLGTEK